MSDTDFVHLHLHTSYSMLDGLCNVEEVMKAVAANRMPAVAITDHGSLYGIIEFYQKARDRGIRPIVGCETYVAYGSRFERKSDGPKTPAHHLVLLATNSQGYSNLVRLITAAHLEGFYYKPRVDKELLASHHEGLIALSACLKGEVLEHLQQKDVERAVRAAGEYADIFGRDSFYLEVQNHNLPEQQIVNQQIREVASRAGVSLVATNDVHYVKKEHADAHEVLLCLQTQTVMSDPKRMRYRTREFYLKTRAEMAAALPGFDDALDRTREVAEKCALEMDFGKHHFPVFEVPKGVTQKEYLLQRVRDGLHRRYGLADTDHPKDNAEAEVLRRFRHEVDVIERTGYVNYYLVVWDFVNQARKRGIPVGLRGSGGSSLVAYALGITDIDPLKYSLLFERFLNVERVSPPDFDIDFCQVRREEMIEYVKEKYGRQNVAQIVTFGTFGAKTVIRDVGRVLEIPYSSCDRLTKMVPDDPKITLRKALAQNPEFQKEYDGNADCKRILDYGFVLEGLCRNVGTHAAGVVIGERPLAEIVPLSRDKDEQIVTQYSMKPLGKIGLLKMDMLGLRTLTVVRDTVDLVKKTRNVEIDLGALPMDDKATFELFNRGDTVGVFQLESSGMRDLIRRVGIGRIEDLIAMIALYRPGPMNNLDEYVNRKSGKAAIRYDHPLLEPILRETYGVMIYQEQVQQAANILAGYSLGQADVLRAAMGKKDAALMAGQEEKFAEGCAKLHKIPRNKAVDLFKILEKFADYGFNKSHSTAYALLAYRTAYLKANYPAEFMSALLSSEMGNLDKLPVFMAESEEMGLKILKPDINSSGVRFVPAEGGIRFGLAGIKNVGVAAVEALVAERDRNGPFRSLTDFCSRVDGQTANRKVIETLVRCGAMDCLGMHRARLFGGIEFAMSRATEALRDRRTGQRSLFDTMGLPGDAAVGDSLPDCPPWKESELLAAEKELLGVYMSGHPLTQHATLLRRYQLATVQSLGSVEDRATTRIGGIVAQLRKTATKEKKPMAIVTLEDMDGSVEVVVYPEAYEKYGSCLVPDIALMVCGQVRKEDKPKIVAQEIYRLEETPRQFAKRLSVHLPAAQTDEKRLEEIRDLFRQFPGPTPVTVCLQFPGGEKVFLDTADGFKVLVHEDLVRELEKRLGEKSVYVAVDTKPCREAGPRSRGPNGGRFGRKP